MDLDPQGNASTALGVDHHSGIAGTYEVLLQHQSIASVQQQSPESETLSVVPATIDLAGAEIELVSVVARESRLTRALAGQRVAPGPSGSPARGRQDVLPTAATFPTGHYHGVTVTVDPRRAPRCLSCFLEDVEVQPAALAD